ncbi:phosphotransferase [Streptomyces sp. GbtcB6]|uniref:phosphotransferase n=1 Tax=Streptomyces sp. GbtcB6 TaxID=2824751 RepID=UPI0027E4928B|nr:phosphotransferase [Streptomyces sp. GbtcB6]
MQNAEYTLVVDVHMFLRQDGPSPLVLLSRRAGPVYATGMWHAPSGRLDGPHEDVIDAVIRETREETGVLVDRRDVRPAVTVHHRAPGGIARMGVFFEARRWQGTPQIMEPDRCDAMDLFALDALPEPMVAYCRAGIDAYRAGVTLAVHFQESGDPIAYRPANDRLTLAISLPADGEKGPEEAVRDFVERAVGPIAAWSGSSWPRPESRVWRVTGVRGGAWYVKQHQNQRFHRREVHALRNWARALGACAPRLVAADDTQRVVVLSELPGQPLHGQVLTPEVECEVYRQIGELTALYHQAAAPAQAAPPGPGKLHRHLDAARPMLAEGDEDLVFALVALRDTLPIQPWVPTLGDLQPRNTLITTTDTAAPASVRVGLIDFERSELGPAVRDFVRLADTWQGRPDLYEALFTGYGRTLTDIERQRLCCEAALDATSGIAYGRAHDDPELIERALRTLRALRMHTFI